MRLSYLIVCTVLAAGCASNAANVPVASLASVPSSPKPTPRIELRHMYLFAPGKSPVLVIDSEAAPSLPQEVSSEPPGRD